MIRILQLTGAFLLITGILLACSKKDKNQPEGGPGFASGKVTNQSGQPLKGAVIVVSNTFSYNKTLTAITNDKGQYSIKLPSGPGIGDWTTSGTFIMNYNGKDYTLPLEAGAHAPFSSTNGGEVNLVLKHTGREASRSPGVLGTFFGGVISCYPGDGADMSKVTITIKPLQPIIDGSTVETKYAAPLLDGDLSWVVNMPIGKYEITAKEGNTTLYIRDYSEGIPDGNVTKLVRDFVPCRVNGARYWIKFDVLRNP